MQWTSPKHGPEPTGGPPPMARRRPVTARRRSVAAGVLLSLMSLLPLSAPAAAAAGALPQPSAFADLAVARWAEPAVVLLAAQGVVKGVSPSSFAPAAPLTGEQAITFLSRIFPGAGVSTPPSETPNGVDPWALSAVEWAEGTGIIQHPTAFRPRVPAPRAQVVAWLVRALGLTGSATATFSDAAAIPPQYAAAVGVAQSDGLVQGDPNGNFDPAAPMTRAQMAVILVRAERALAFARAGTPALFNWGYVQGSASQPIATGTVQAGSTSLPIGTIDAGVVQTRDGRMQERYVLARGIGAGTLRVTRGGATLDIPVVWRAPANLQDGRLWLFMPGSAGPAGYSYAANPQAVAFQRAAPGPSLAPGGAVASNAAPSGGISAKVCTGAADCASGGTYETYDGPAVRPILLWMMEAVQGTEMVPGS